MKRIITLFSFVFCAGMMFSQGAPIIPALKIASNGNVGIGTDSPGTKLHIKGGSLTLEPIDHDEFTQTSVNIKGTDPTTRFKFQNFDNPALSNAYFQLFGQDINNPNRTGEVTFSGAYQRFFYGVVSSSTDPDRFGTEGMRLTDDGKLAVGETFVDESEIAKFNGDIEATDFVTPSDRKLKSNIRNFDYGLDEVLRMSPRFYNYNGSVVAESNTKAGIIAQEFEKILPEAVREVKYQKHNFENEVVEEGTYKAVSTSMIKFALINAIKEQQDMIDELRVENEELRDLVQQVVKTISESETRIDVALDGPRKMATLSQNSPNPFIGNTELNYFIPDEAQYAQMIITSNTGQIIKTIDIAHKGAGVISLTGNEIPVGNYHYTLSINGKKIDTKTMTVIK